MLTRPLITRTHLGFLHFVTWIDDKSPKVFVNAMCKKRSEVARHLCAFTVREELQTGHLQKSLPAWTERANTPSEEVQSILKDKGLPRETTSVDPTSTQQSGDRMIRTPVEASPVYARRSPT